MHNSDLPDDVVERAAARRGRRHVFDPLDPARAALLVIDLQNYFMEPGQALEIPAARDIVPNVNRLARAVLANILNCFGDVRTSDEAVGLLEAAPERRTSALV